MLKLVSVVSKVGRQQHLVRQLATSSVRSGKIFSDINDKRFDQHFLDIFNDPNIDGFHLRTAMQNLHEYDMIPDPDLCGAVLRACRRVNDFALAVRFVEAVSFKCGYKKSTRKWLMEKIKPTLEELGIPTLEELKYDKPELFVPMPEYYWDKKWYKDYGFDKHGYEY